MKLAVIKLGSRISFNAKDTSGGNGEAKNVIGLLLEGGAEINVYTKILKKDVNPDNIKFHNIEDEYKNINNHNYDALIIINGQINYFGGIDSPDQTLNYNIINNFKGAPFYIYCDPALKLTQIWPSIEKKPWADKYKKSDIQITRTDITYISQPYDLKAVKEIQSKIDIKIANTVHFPFEKFPCMHCVINKAENPSLDLAYGGTMRGGKRIDKMIKFYFGYSEDIKVEMFGKMDEEALIEHRNKKFNKALRAPDFGAPVQYNEFTKKMNDTLAHVVIGDKWYEGKDMAQRCYESIWSNVVTFIDIELDPKKRVFGHNEFLSKMLYVKDAKEVEKRIKFIKQNPDVRDEILTEQFKAVNFDKKQYCQELIDIIKMKTAIESNTVTKTVHKTASKMFEDLDLD